MGRTGTGVELRDKSIRVGFKWQGEWCRETLNIEPTPANEKHAVRLVAQVRRAIGNGSFDYAQFFPDSKRAQAEAPARITLKTACESYVKAIGNLEAATRDQYENALANVWQPLLGADVAFDAITHALLAEKIGEKAWASGKSCNNYLIPLRGLFAMHYTGPRTLHNPMIGIKNMATVKKRPDPLTAIERDKVLADLDARCDARVAAYFRFAFFTGMRPEELIALQWGDVDWNNGAVRVQRVRTFRGSERDGTKTNVERDVDLVAPALAALQAMKPWTQLKPGGDIFESPITGAAWHDERSQRDTFWKPSLRRAGVRYRTSYKTRHTYATTMLMAGLKPAYIAQQLGHSLQVLLSTYARWIPGADGGDERTKMRALFEAAPEKVAEPAAPGVPRAANDA